MSQSICQSGLSWRALFGMTALFLISEVLNGPLRYGLSHVGLDALIYAPKALLLLAFIFVPLVRRRATPGFLMIGAIAIVYLALGMVQLPSKMQALFGLWMMAPLLFGFLAGSVLMHKPEHLGRLVAVLFWTAWTGVVLNVLVSYPWVGSNYQLAGSTIETSRQWTTSGFYRLPGFSRASFSAANQLLMFGIFLVFTLQSHRLRKLIWIAAGLGIVLTTSKVPIVSWMLVTLYLITRPRGLKQVWSMALIVIATSTVLLPLSTLIIDYNSHFNDPIIHMLFASLGDRLNWMWPESLNLLKDPWQWLTGLGLGGIGTSQHYFDPVHYLAGDNLFVYLCAEFGVIAALSFMVWATFTAIQHNQETGTYNILASTLILAILAIGGASNVLEGPVLGLFLALSLTKTTRWQGSLKTQQLHLDIPSLYHPSL